MAKYLPWRVRLYATICQVLPILPWCSITPPLFVLTCRYGLYQAYEEAKMNAEALAFAERGLLQVQKLTAIEGRKSPVIQPHTHTLAHTNAHTHTQTHAHAHTQTQTNSFSLSPAQTLSHTHKLTHSLTRQAIV